MFDAGQKVIFRTMVGCIAVMRVAGNMAWRPRFEGLFPALRMRIATLIGLVCVGWSKERQCAP